jgi:type I restriction enzyme S subunit
MSDVPEGYRMTEVGVIPEDWEVKELGDCLLKKPEYGINAPAVAYSDNLPVYLRITDISDDGRFLAENITSVDNINSHKYLLEKDDVVFARTGASTGKTYLYNPKDGELVFAGFLIRVKVNSNDLIAQYLKNYTETAIYWNWVRIMSMRSGQPGINGNEYSQLKIPLPPLPEQQAIASALSDVDALITALEQLIAKKRNIKQGAMQQLLTGKKRLPGFGEEWEKRKLGDIFRISAGGDYISQLSSNDQDEMHCFPIYSNSITDHGLYGYCSYFVYESDSITVTARGTLGTANFRNHKFTAIGRVLVLQPNYPLDCYYVSEYINNRIDFVVESTGVPQLTSPQISKYEIILPSLAEQRAIAQILSDMDTEIETLEQKRDKYKAIKQGMMQELLTGKTRLV